VAPQSRNTSGRAVATNALTAYVTLAVGSLAGFLTTPILLRSLGVVRFGTWSLLVAAAAYIGLLEVGLSSATSNRIAAIESDGAGAVRDVLCASQALFSIVAILALIVTGIASIFVPSVFHVASSGTGQAALAFLWLGSAQAIGALVSVFSALFVGTGRMYLLNLGGAAIATATTAAQAVVALTGGGIADLGVVQFIGTAASWLYFRQRSRRVFSDITISIRSVRRSIARRLLSLGSKNAVSYIAGTLAFGSDLAVIGVLLSPKAAAAYAVALSGYTFLQRLSTVAVGAIAPSHAHHAGNAGPAERFELLRVSLLVTLIPTVLGGLTLGVFAHGLLHLWLGHVPTHSTTVLTIFCVVLLLQAPGVCAFQFLVASELAGEVARLVVLSSTTNLSASVALTATVGVAGPVLGSLCAIALFDAVLLPRRACRALNDSYWRLLRLTCRPLVLPTLLLTITLAIGRLLVSGGPAILLVAGLATVVYSAALWSTPSVRDLRRRTLRR
jgi:O-antigen/teichoic acid export membrane protein